MGENCIADVASRFITGFGKFAHFNDINHLCIFQLVKELSIMSVHDTQYN